MQSFFEIKTKVAFDAAVFENMKETAAKLLYNTESGQYTQAVVLFSATGNTYSTVVKNALSKEKTDEMALLERIKAIKDTEIRYVLCMWQDTCIDIPSFAFRELLCALNPKNAESMVLVTTTDGVSGMTVSATMK